MEELYRNVSRCIRPHATKSTYDGLDGSPVLKVEVQKTINLVKNLKAEHTNNILTKVLKLINYLTCNT